MTRNRSSRQVALAGALAAVLGAITILAVTGSREPADALRLLSGDAWLGNGKLGSASHVDGYGGRADAQVGVVRPGDPFRIIQRPDGAYVLDLRTGTLTRVGSDTLSTDASRRLPGQPSALQVLTTGQITWVLDSSSGLLQQVNPTTLAPLGDQIPLGAATGTAAVDTGTGDLWVPLPSRGVVDQVSTAGAVSSHPVGQPGDVVQLAATTDGVWAVDGQSGQAVPLSTGGAPLSLPQAPAGVTPIVGSSPSSGYVAVLQGDQLLDVDTSPASLGSTSSSAYQGASQVAVVNNTAYLLDPEDHQLDVVNLDPLTPEPPVDVPPGSNQLVPKDGLLFVNDTASPQAVVVNNDGQVTPVTKYVPQAPNPSSSGPAPNPLSVPSMPQASSNPRPSPGPGPSGGGSPAGPQPAPAGGGNPVAPTGANPAPVKAPITPTSPTTRPTPAVPGAPTIISVTPAAGSVGATWSAPANPGSSPITHYTLQVTPQSGSGARTTTATGTAGQVNGLTGDTTYCAQVQAVNAAGSGPLSPHTPADCVRTTKDTPGQVAAPQVQPGAGQIAVGWAAPALGPYNTPIRSYTVTATPSGGGTPVSVSASGTNTVVPNLSAGVTYAVTVQATNQTGGQGPVSAATAATTDSTPGAFSVTVTPHANELDVSWTAASVNNGQSVAYRVSDGRTMEAPSSNSYAFTGLSAGTNYTITVTATSAGGATNSGGSGTPWSRTSSLYVCRSTDKGNQWVTSSSACEPGGGPATLVGKASFNWATSPQPPGSTTLYREYGTTTPSNYNSGTQYWYTSGDSSDPSGLLVTGGPSTVTWVFTSQAAAGPGSSHVCEALVHQTFEGQATSYYELFSYGSEPGTCVVSFWT